MSRRDDVALAAMQSLIQSGDYRRMVRTLERRDNVDATLADEDLAIAAYAIADQMEAASRVPCAACDSDPDEPVPRFVELERPHANHGSDS